VLPDAAARRAAGTTRGSEVTTCAARSAARADRRSAFQAGATYGSTARRALRACGPRADRRSTWAFCKSMIQKLFVRFVSTRYQSAYHICEFESQRELSGSSEPTGKRSVVPV